MTNFGISHGAGPSRRIPLVGILCVVLASGCSSRGATIPLSPHVDLNAVVLTRSFDDLKRSYSVSKTIRFGPDPDLHEKAMELARENVHVSVPERRVTFTLTAWDLPLIKAYLKEQRIDSRSSVGEELQRRLLADHRRYTQFLLAVESDVRDYFSWDDWTAWIEDAKGRTMFPVRVQETSEDEVVLSLEEERLGRTTIRPEYDVFYDYGTLYFERIYLPAASPVTIVLLDRSGLGRIELTMRFSGDPPRVDDGDAPSAYMEPGEKIDKLELMRLHFQQATAHFKNGDFERAVNEWEKVLALDPGHDLSRAKIAKAKAALADARSARNAYTASQKRRRMQVHFFIATEHFKAGDYEAAIGEWRSVLALDPDHALSKRKIEKARERLGGGDPGY